MSAIRFSISFLVSMIAACSIFTSVFAEPELLPEDQRKQKPVEYQTAAAEYKEFENEIVFTSSKTVVKEIPQVYHGEGVYYVKALVRTNEWVNAGDPIMEVKSAVTDVQIEKEKLELSRLKETLADELRIRQLEIQRINLEAAKAETERSRQILSLQSQRAAVEMNRYSAEMNGKIEDQEGYLSSLEAQCEITEILAETSGTVHDIISPGSEMITDGTQICVIDEELPAEICVDSKLPIYHGKQVYVTLKDKNDREIHANGRVSVSSPELKGNSADESKVYIALDENTLKNAGIEKISDCFAHSKVQVKCFYAENALMIPIGAIQSDIFGTYVELLCQTSVVQKRYIFEISRNGKEAWVTGLEEGDRVILK